MHISSKVDFDCETCTKGKMTQYRNRNQDKKATNILELIHCDLAGPIDPPAREGFSYAMSFVDDYSGVIMVYLLKNKNDTVAAMERFLADSAPYGSVKRIRTDNGGEFTSAEFRSFLMKNHIKHEFSAPYSPHQNGTAERSWRTLFEMARCLLLEASLPKKLWTYAVKTSAYIRNRCYNPRTGKNPYEMMTGVKPNLKNMHIFGTYCYAYIQNKKKLDDRCERGIFLGYDTQSPAYLMYFSEKNDVKRVRCVKFNEKLEGKCEYVEEYTRPKSYVSEETTTLPPQACPQETTQPKTEEDEDNIEERRYPQRNRNKPKHLEAYVMDDEDLSSVAKCSIDYCYRVANIPSTVCCTVP